MPEDLVLNVLRRGHQITVASDQFEINIELSENSLDISESDDFAVWLGLLVAMREGRNLRLSGPISPTVIENAHRISEFWAFCSPDLFEPVRVFSDTQFQPEAAPSKSPDIMCFSGGMDSTFALVRHVEITGKKPVLLSVHGLDYHSRDNDKFARLLRKTLTTRDKFGLETMSVRSNAGEVFQKFNVGPDIHFAFNLFACMFLFQHRFASGLISADNPINYEWARMPYGSNSISNPQFANDHFGIQTLGLDASRSQKAGYLSQFPDVLQTLSFCKNRKIRPRNCGICEECCRAKSIFFAETGRVPDIFIEPQFNPKDLSFLNPHAKNFHVVAADILSSAQRNGRTSEFAGLRDVISQRLRTNIWQRRINKIRRRSNRIRSKFNINF